MNESKKKGSGRLSTIESFVTFSMHRGGAEVLVVGHEKMDSVVYLVNDGDVDRPIRVGVMAVGDPGDEAELERVAIKVVS